MAPAILICSPPMSVIRKLNPFAGLPNAKEVWAWGMFDLANQSFTLLINTLLFAVYFKEVVVNDEAQGDRLWAILFSSSMFRWCWPRR